MNSMRNLEYDPKDLVALLGWMSESEPEEDEVAVEVNAADEEC